MKNGILPEASLADMFIGNVGGCVGEVSAIALLIGGIYLIARKVIRIRSPWPTSSPWPCSPWMLLRRFCSPGRQAALSPGCSMRSSAAACSWCLIFMATDLSPAPIPPRDEVIPSGSASAQAC